MENSFEMSFSSSQIPVQLRKFSAHAFPQAKSQQTVAVVKLEDSGREKREEEEDLLPMSGLVTKVAARRRC